MRDEAYYRSKLETTAHPIPEHMHDGLINYLVHRVRPGHFLAAILANDLRGACDRADEANRAALYAYVYFLTNYAPGGAWGSWELVRDYLTADNVIAREPRTYAAFNAEGKRIRVTIPEGGD